MSMMPAATSQRAATVCVCLLCATSRWLCGEGALPASTATTTATATLTLLTWTWTWRLTGVFGASWARFMAAFCCCFFSLPASLLFSFRFFLHVSWHEVLKSKACIVWVVARCVCVCVGVSYRIWCYVCIAYAWERRVGQGSGERAGKVAENFIGTAPLSWFVVLLAQQAHT